MINVLFKAATQQQIANRPKPKSRSRDDIVRAWAPYIECVHNRMARQGKVLNADDETRIANMLENALQSATSPEEARIKIHVIADNIEYVCR